MQDIVTFSFSVNSLFARCGKIDTYRLVIAAGEENKYIRQSISLWSEIVGSVETIHNKNVLMSPNKANKILDGMH